MTAMVCSCFIFSVDGHLSFPPLVLFSPLVAVLDTAESPHRQGNRGSSNPRLTGAWVVSGRAPVQTQPCDLPLLTPTPPLASKLSLLFPGTQRPESLSGSWHTCEDFSISGNQHPKAALPVPLWSPAVLSCSTWHANSACKAASELH
jgi:hypothetical protein